MPGVKKVATVALLQQLSTIFWVDGGSQANIINQVWGLWSVDRSTVQGTKPASELQPLDSWINSSLQGLQEAEWQLLGNWTAAWGFGGGINQSGSNSDSGG